MGLGPTTRICVVEPNGHPHHGREHPVMKDTASIDKDPGNEEDPDKCQCHGNGSGPSHYTNPLLRVECTRARCHGDVDGRRSILRGTRSPKCRERALIGGGVFSQPTNLQATSWKAQWLSEETW